MQEYIELATKEGTLRGFFHKPNLDKFPVCIIFHGFTGQKTGTRFSYVKIARMLAKHGIGAIRFDFLGTGDSDLDFCQMTFIKELHAAIDILQYVKGMSTTTDIYLLGHSMGGAIASEVAKRYPQDIQKVCLWAPAFNMPEAIRSLIGEVLPNEDGIYDQGGFEISQAFVDEVVQQDLYQGIGIYQGELLIIHGDHDEAVPYDIHEKYMAMFHKRAQLLTIIGGSHNFDTIIDQKMVINKTLHFLINQTQ